MKPRYACAVVLAALAACSAPPKESTTENDATAPDELKAPTLTMKWETDASLTTCESVLYDKTNDVLYVADIDGDPSKADGVGFIAKVGLDGKVIDAKWVKGLNAPKGMGLANGKLYVADITEVVEIDPSNGKITKKYPVDGSQFLNDITTDDSGRVFVSDSNTGTVSVIENGKVGTFLTGHAGVNGLLVDGDKFLLASFSEGTLSQTSEGQVTQIASGVENADGIEAVGDGGYLVSSWNGKVTYVSADGRTKEILNTVADSVSAADIEYIPEKKLLLVPTFFKNKVVAYELAN